MRYYLEFPRFCARVLAKINEGDGWRSLRELKRDFRNHMKTGFEPDRQSVPAWRTRPRSRWIRNRCHGNVEDGEKLVRLLGGNPPDEGENG